MEDKKEQLLFACVSKVDREAVDRFNKHIGKKVMTSGVALIIGFCALVGGLLCLVNLFLGITTIGVGVVIGAPLTGYIIKDAMKKQSESFLAGNKYLVHYDFFEDDIVIRAQVAEENEKNYQPVGEEVVSYAQILKVIVHDTDIYIQRQGQANIIDQRGMTKGTAGELIDFLKKKGLKMEGVAKSK